MEIIRYRNPRHKAAYVAVTDATYCERLYLEFFRGYHETSRGTMFKQIRTEKQIKDEKMEGLS